MVYQLYGGELAQGDQAYPVMIARLVPAGLSGLILAGLTGAIMSSLNCMLNSCSTIWTNDLYHTYINPDSEDHHLVTVGRIATIVFMILACLWAQTIRTWDIRGIFNYIQKFWGFISPGILAVFLFGLFLKKTPRIGSLVGLIICVPAYGLMMWLIPEVAFLNRMVISFALVCAWLAFARAMWPEEGKEMPVREDIDMTPARDAKVLGVIIIVIVIALYIVFR